MQGIRACDVLKQFWRIHTLATVSTCAIFCFLRFLLYSNVTFSAINIHMHKVHSANQYFVVRFLNINNFFLSYTRDMEGKIISWFFFYMSHAILLHIYKYIHTQMCLKTKESVSWSSHYRSESWLVRKNHIFVTREQPIMDKEKNFNEDVIQLLTMTCLDSASLHQIFLLLFTLTYLFKKKIEQYIWLTYTAKHK